MKKRHLLLIQVDQDEVNGAMVTINIQGEDHIIAAAIAGLFKTETRLLGLFEKGLHLAEKHDIQTFTKKPGTESH